MKNDREGENDVPLTPGQHEQLWQIVVKLPTDVEPWGQPGSLRDDRGWIRTLCDHHAIHTPKFVPMGAEDEMTGSIRALIKNQEKTENFLDSQEKRKE